VYEREIGAFIDARAKTTETVIKAHVSAEIQSSEERLRAEILAARAEAKADHLQLAGKVDKIAKNHERRLEALEEKTGTPKPQQKLIPYCIIHLPRRTLFVVRNKKCFRLAFYTLFHMDAFS
jgi:GTP-binding protein EngB required for normal cell division